MKTSPAKKYENKEATGKISPASESYHTTVEDWANAPIQQKQHLTPGSGKELGHGECPGCNY